MAQAYPLQWPDGWPRTKPTGRTDGRAKFKRGDWRGGYCYTTVAVTREELSDELVRLGARNVVLSTNLELRLDGKPYSNRRDPEDPGVAVYFTLDGEAMVMARDAYTTVSDNIRSLTLAISGLRQVERHGGGIMLKRAFAGFAALPPPDAMVTPTQRAWWVVLGVDSMADREAIQKAWKAKVREASDDERLEINLARDAGLTARGEG